MVDCCTPYLQEAEVEGVEGQMGGASRSPGPMEERQWKGERGRDQAEEAFPPHESLLPLHPDKPWPWKQLWSEGAMLPGTLHCGLREPPPSSRLTSSPATGVLITTICRRFLSGLHPCYSMCYQLCRRSPQGSMSLHGAARTET